LAYGYFFECLIYGSQRTTEARKLGAAITPSKAFGKHVQYLLKLDPGARTAVAGSVP
jgi:hypothetical protein